MHALLCDYFLLIVQQTMQEGSQGVLSPDSVILFWIKNLSDQTGICTA